MAKTHLSLVFLVLLAACTQSATSPQVARHASSGLDAGTSNSTNSHQSNQTGAPAPVSLDGTWTSPCLEGVSGQKRLTMVFNGSSLVSTVSYYNDSACQSGITAAVATTGTLTAQGANAAFPAATNYVSTASLVTINASTQSDAQFFAQYLATPGPSACQNLPLVAGTPLDITACTRAASPLKLEPSFSFYQVVGNRLYLGADGNNGNDGSTVLKRNDVFDRQTYFVNSALPAASSCTTSLAIVGGQQTTSYPAVVRLGSMTEINNANAVSACSATFISATAAITAAHCIPDGGDISHLFLVPGTFNSLENNPQTIGTPALQVFGLGVYGQAMAQAIANNDIATEAKDIAIVTFPPGVAPAVMPLSNAQLTTNAPLVIVGYGNSSFAGQTVVYDGAKRVGQSVALSYDAGALGTVLYYGDFTPSAIAAAQVGSTASISEGDSGGAVIFGNALAATISTTSVYVDQSTPIQNSGITVSSTNALAVIAQANASGAAIPAAGAQVPVLTQPAAAWTPPTCL